MSVQKNEHNACQFCDQNFACGVLKTAMEILSKDEHMGTSTKALDAIEKLRQKVEASGFNFPDSKTLCSLHDRPEEIAKLIGESIVCCRIPYFADQA